MNLRRPGRRVNLENKCPSIPIQDQTGKTIILPVNASIAGRVLVEDSFRQGRFKAAFPKCGVDLDWFSNMQNAEANWRLGIVKTDREKFIVAIENDGEFAGAAFAILFFDAVGENPGMAAAHDRFGGRTQAQAECFRSRGFH